ncbi:hypothetical protein [Bradyrhizobium quebecense]|uniref:Uncharacterized protein n=2 Tax=Bradyrhizobium quebecense TaxID=2748629 RepID=A0ACD3VA59_9BRAD|nr:hypothetical protein [Bradyrhizobium quebecense]UGY03278.1 hypothetical protein J4P68_0000400 [Bradyrhizobium quebecense]
MADQYRVGVTIALTNGVSPILSTIMADLLRVERQIGKVSSLFNTWKPAIIAAGAALAGGELIKGLHEVVKAGGDVNHQLELMKIAGMSNTEVQTSMATAMKTSGAVLTTTLSENLKHLRELRYAFGDIGTAEGYLGSVSRANAILNAVRGGGKDEVWELVKSLEQKGETADPASFLSYIDTMTKVVEATGGRVTPQMYMSTFKYGRSATLGWDEGFIGGALPRLIQSMASAGGGGGSGTGGPGNALMSAFSEVSRGQVTKQSAEEFERLGLGKAEHIKGSSSSHLDVASRGLFMRDPYEWVQQTLMPALHARGVDSNQQILEEVAKLFPNRTASQVIGEMALQGRFHEGEKSPFEKDIKLQHGAMGLPAYDELIKHDYPTILRAFNQQFQNLLETLGSPLMAPDGAVIKGMAGLASAMGALAQAAGSETFKGIASTIGTIVGDIAKVDEVIVKALGWLSGITPVFRAMGDLPWQRIADGAASASAALGHLAGVAWEKIVAMFDGIKNAILAFIDRLGGLLGRFSNHGQPGVDIEGAPRSPTRFEAPDRQRGGIIPVNFNPGHRQTQVTPVTTNFNIDGRTLGQWVIDIISEMTMFPTGAAAADGAGRWAPPDQNWDDT